MPGLKVNVHSLSSLASRFKFFKKSNEIFIPGFKIFFEVRTKLFPCKMAIILMPGSSFNVHSLFKKIL